MLKRLVMWTGCLSWCILAVANIRAEDQKPNPAGTAQPVQAETRKEEPADEKQSAQTEQQDPAEPDAVQENQQPGPLVLPKPAPEVRVIGELPWHIDYSAAYRQANTEHKQLLLFFRSEKDLLTAGQLEQNALSRPELKDSLSKFVRVVLFTSAVAPVDKDPKPDTKPVKLLDFPCFAHMQGQPGLAIVDLQDKNDHLFGKCISAHPFTSNTLNSVGTVKTMLELPRGTITQRTLTYVLRTHPEQPASVWGQGNPLLFEQCRVASQLMVNYGSVGHHDWGNRSAYVGGQFGSSPMEVASMGAGNTLFEVAHSVVNLWRGSGVHWGMMITPNRHFGYDMVQSPSGTWFANGIFVP
ncbi:MAG: hypothetical protein JWM11_7523 [Planctomycetaceae bacterium]|nr:hypothetical protein [Planctomycetaceae bacterium]